MTPFVIAYVFGGICCMAVAWLYGGPAEREGAMIWIVNWVISHALGDLELGSLRAGVALADLVALAAFVRLSLRHDRWWPFLVTACMVLWMGLHLTEALQPNLSRVGALSAQLGPSLLGVLLLGVGSVERWLAGETSVSAGARWRSWKRS